MADSADDLKLRLARAFSAGIPHNAALGIQIREMAPSTVLFEPSRTIVRALS